MTCPRCFSILFWRKVGDQKPNSNNTYELFDELYCPCCSHTISVIAEENRSRRPKVKVAKRGMVGV